MQLINRISIRVFLLLFCWVFASGLSRAQKGSNTHFTIRQIDLDQKERREIKKEIDFNEENAIYSYKKYINAKDSLPKNLKILLTLNTGMDSLKYEKHSLHIYTNFAEEPKEQLFYGFIADSYPSSYYKWNDIYKVLFDLKEIKNIIWWNNHEKATIFPSTEDWNQVHPPRFILKKKWFFPNTDYAQIIEEDTPQINEEFMIEDAGYLDALLKTKPELQSEPPKCF